MHAACSKAPPAAAECRPAPAPAQTPAPPTPACPAQAMSVVLAHAAYLPAAQCFALLPLAGAFRRTGSGSGAVLDYDVERGAVTVVAQRSYRWAGGPPGWHTWWEACSAGRQAGSRGTRTWLASLRRQRRLATQRPSLQPCPALPCPACSPGQEVAVYDGRPNGELLLATGEMEAGNPAGTAVGPARELSQRRRARFCERAARCSRTRPCPPNHRALPSPPCLPRMPCRLPVHGGEPGGG